MTLAELLERLPPELSINDKGDSYEISYSVPILNGEGVNVFGVSIDCRTRLQGLNLILQTLRNNDVGYDEITRKTRWQ